MAYVRYEPWSGDLPIIYFSADNKTHLVLSGAGKRARSWVVHTDMWIEMGAKQRRDEGFDERQPEWAFVVSNGKDQVSLMHNAGKPVLCLETHGGGCSMYHNLSVADAERMARDLRRYAAFGIPDPSTAQVRGFKPLGSGVSYRAKRSAFSASVAKK